MDVNLKFQSVTILKLGLVSLWNLMAFCASLPHI